jgi:hypothetical protein
MDYTVSDILLTRGDGPINDSRFSGAILWGAPAPDDYLIERYRRLAVTERSKIKAAACVMLWICAQDQPAPYAQRQVAAAAMREANWNCTVERRGPNCGPMDQADSDPPQ